MEGSSPLLHYEFYGHPHEERLGGCVEVPLLLDP
jgi:hypothetical protein